VPEPDIFPDMPPGGFRKKKTVVTAGGDEAVRRGVLRKDERSVDVRSLVTPHLITDLHDGLRVAIKPDLCHNAIPSLAFHRADHGQCCECLNP
jgi:hypothetical protein